MKEYKLPSGKASIETTGGLLATTEYAVPAKASERNKALHEALDQCLYLSAQCGQLQLQRDIERESVKQLTAEVEALMKIVQGNALIHISASTAKIGADAVESINLDRYDAVNLNDFGGGNVGWWQDYIRSELARAHDFYQSQLQQYADNLRQGGAK